MSPLLHALLGLLVALGSCQPTPAPSPPSPISTSPPDSLAVEPRAPLHDDPPAPAAEPEAPPPEQAKAPYDLAAELRRLEQEARRDLGEKVTTTTVRGVYLVIGAPGWGKAQVA